MELLMIMRKDEQCHLLHLEAKWAVAGRVVQKMEI